MNYLIGISGRMGAGKDEVANIIQQVAMQQYLFKVKKFAYKVKLIASILTGIPVEKFEDQDFKHLFLPSEWAKLTLVNDSQRWVEKPTFTSLPMSVREMLQRIGTDCLRDNLHKETWVNALFSDYTENENWLISDVRFPNEAKAIKERNGILIRVNRGVDTENAHESEIALDNYHEFDYIIDNNGSLGELKLKVKEIWQEIQTSKVLS